jgi:hypothetical protein
MNAPTNCRLIGGWRIIGADPRNRAHLDICDPATLTIIAEARPDPLSMTVGLGQAGVDAEAVALLHERMPIKQRLASFAQSVAIERCYRRRRAYRGCAEIRFSIPPALASAARPSRLSAGNS